MVRLLALAWSLGACVSPVTTRVGPPTHAATIADARCGEAVATVEAIGTVAQIVGVPAKWITAASTLYQLHETARCTAIEQSAPPPPPPPPTAPIVDVAVAPSVSCTPRDVELTTVASGDCR